VGEPTPQQPADQAESRQRPPRSPSARPHTAAPAPLTGNGPSGGKGEEPSWSRGGDAVTGGVATVGVVEPGDMEELLDLGGGRWDGGAAGVTGCPWLDGWRTGDDLSDRHDAPSFSPPPYSPCREALADRWSGPRAGCARVGAALTRIVAGR
jgi:hypothetical protein